jgi:hypothetical protein
MWIEIFKTGEWTDSNGSTRTWTGSDIDGIVTNYNPSFHEAPVVIGHPRDDAPAWGWVKALKRSGNVLLAKLKDLAPEFKEMVNRGLFKKRSISLYQDMSLRHLAFLGAQPPAVKGLAAFSFSEPSAVTYDFAEAGPGCCAGQNVAERLSLIIDGKMNTNPALSYSQAFTESQRENVDLALEYATNILGQPRSDSAGQELDALVKLKQNTNPALSYSQAFAEVQKENQDLIYQYMAEI